MQPHDSADRSLGSPQGYGGSVAADTSKGFGPAWLLRQRLGEPGEVYTFYSYKGGTGRSMGLVNCAGLIAQHLPTEAPPLLLVDFDLEAPGLHRYLDPCVDRKALAAAPGVLELFEALAAQVDALLTERGVKALDDESAAELLTQFDLTAYRVPVRLPGADQSAPVRLQLITAGRFDEQYDARLAAFDWPRLYARAPALFRAFSARVASEHSFVFVDSRTGLSDTSGISTMLLPDVLVVVFTPNSQSLTGIEHLVRRAFEYRQQASDSRPLRVYPLASRVDNQVEHFRQVWRLGDVHHALFGQVRGYQPLFQALFEQTLAADVASLGPRLADYFDQVQVPHAADYAFGERLCFGLQASSDSLSIRGAYELFLPWLVTGAQPWERPADTVTDLRAQLWLREAGVSEESTSTAGWSAWFDRLARATATSEFAQLPLAALSTERCFDVALAQSLAQAHVGAFAAARIALDTAGTAYSDSAAPSLVRHSPTALLGLLRGDVPPPDAQADAAAWLVALDKVMGRWQSLKADRRAWLQALIPLAKEWSLPELYWRAATELEGGTSAMALEAQLAVALARHSVGDVAGALALAEPLVGHLPPDGVLAGTLLDLLPALRTRQDASPTRPLPAIGECESTAFICAAHADDEASYGWVREFSGELDRGLRSRLRGVRLPQLANASSNRAVAINVSAALEHQIAKSFAFVLIMSEETAQSKWCQHEVEAFFHLYGDAARERLYLVATSQQAATMVLGWPLWKRFGSEDQVWLRFYDTANPNRPLAIYADKGVVTSAFFESFVRLRDQLVEQIQRSIGTDLRGTPQLSNVVASTGKAGGTAQLSGATAIGAETVLGVPAASESATVYIESNRNERDQWEAIGQLLRKHWRGLHDFQAPRQLRVRGLPLDQLSSLHLLAEADGVLLLWGRKAADTVVSQVNKIENLLPGDSPCPGLVAHISPPQPESDDPMPACGWSVLRFLLPNPDQARVHEDENAELDRFLGKVLAHAVAREQRQSGSLAP